MKYTSTSIIFLTVLLLTACATEHPTLDDFVLDDEIIIDAQDLLNDDQNKGIELEKDAQGDVVASKNPMEQSNPTNKKEQVVVISERANYEIALPSKQTKEPQKENAKAPEKKFEQKKVEPSVFTRRAKDFTASNVPVTPAFFDANALGLHLLGKPIMSATCKPEEEAHTKAIMEMKASYEERNLSKMTAWRDQYLISVPRPDETLFYPFSGPDVVNMLTFFPNQQTYVMMGMEYVGTAETVNEWMKPLTKTKMDTIRKAVESVFIRSFFRTLDMSSDFSRNGTRGVLPGMLLMLKVLDRDVKSVQWVTLNVDGSLRYLTPEATKTASGNFGVEIKVTHPTQGFEQTIYYFKTDLSDAPMASNAGLRNFIQGKLGTTMTFVKSASFLMHMKEFGWMRNTVLNTSRAVLQDDSGVPFKFYKKNDWTPHLYGQYVGPYGESFAAFKQPELNKAYDSMPLQLLDFSFGYGYAKIPSHLMLFIRREN
ncbi:MAG: hypothetical protein Q8Q56_00060 [Alphaproteobacteria bacterium]|nr:hypothetical protein [Alphaproteobacteria bacterium]